MLWAAAVAALTFVHQYLINQFEISNTHWRDPSKINPVIRTYATTAAKIYFIVVRTVIASYIATTLNTLSVNQLIIGWGVCHYIMLFSVQWGYAALAALGCTLDSGMSMSIAYDRSWAIFGLCIFDIVVNLAVLANAV